MSGLFRTYRPILRSHIVERLLREFGISQTLAETLLTIYESFGPSQFTPQELARAMLLPSISTAYHRLHQLYYAGLLAKTSAGKHTLYSLREDVYAHVCSVLEEVEREIKKLAGGGGHAAGIAP